MVKITKRWGNLVYFFNLFKGHQNLGKISKPILPNNLFMLMLFPRINKLSCPVRIGIDIIKKIIKYAEINAEINEFDGIFRTSKLVATT